MLNGVYFYPNKFALATLNSLEEVMGRNGLNAILRLADLKHLIDNYPPDNMERKFHFEDFSALNTALDVFYGLRGGRGLALRAGQAVFDNTFREFEEIARVEDPDFKAQPLDAKMRFGVQVIAYIFSHFSDQLSSVEELGDRFYYASIRCPSCWGRNDLEKPGCYFGAGMLQAGMKWFSDGRNFRVTQTKCIAIGDRVCEYTIPKSPISTST